MDWTIELQERADDDLKEFAHFDISRTLGLRYVFIKIKEGHLFFNRLPQHTFGFANDWLNWILPKLSVSELPDVEIPLYVGDSYGWEDENVHFCWSKPAGKRGLLFPAWEFLHWDRTQAQFKAQFVPWNRREDGPFFVGRNTSSEFTNIRKHVQTWFPKHVTLFDEKRSEAEIRTIGMHPTELCRFKTVFDLPGRTPWSGRSALIALSGSSPVRVLQFHSKWGEGPWFQFWENPNNMQGIRVDCNWRKSLSTETLAKLKPAFQKEIAEALTRQMEAQTLREKMMSLKTHHIVEYLEHIFRKVGKKQND